MKSRYIIPIFVPHKGCPNQCIFCNQKRISGQIKEITIEDAKKTIEEYISLNKNDDEISKILNLKPYAIKMSRQYIAKNGIKFYINLYQKYVDLDYEIKSGKITPANALYELIF